MLWIVLGVGTICLTAWCMWDRYMEYLEKKDKKT